jgi:dihydrofolate reductase
VRKIRAFAHISLDGVISPGGQGEDSDYAHGGWTAPYRTQAGAGAVAEAQGTNFDLLLGRRTYDLWAAVWPKAPGSPIADSLNAAKKHVVTHRPDSLAWGPVSHLGTDLVKGIRGLKSSDGPDLIVWGSTTVTSVLFGRGLVDEVVLIVYPVLLGRGNRFFPESVDPCELAFVNTKTTPTGVLLNAYRYVGTLHTQPPPK